MKANFVLVDFENVQPDNVGVLNGRSFKIKVFVGASQAKIPFELARTLHAFGPDAVKKGDAPLFKGWRSPLFNFCGEGMDGSR